jgi:hypothetical protein
MRTSKASGPRSVAGREAGGSEEPRGASGSSELEKERCSIRSAPPVRLGRPPAGECQSGGGSGHPKPAPSIHDHPRVRGRRVPLLPGEGNPDEAHPRPDAAPVEAEAPVSLPVRGGPGFVAEQGPGGVDLPRPGRGDHPLWIHECMFPARSGSFRVGLAEGNVPKAALRESNRDGTPSPLKGRNRSDAVRWFALQRCPCDRSTAVLSEEPPGSADP